MGSTSFMVFSYPNLLLVFLNLLFFRNLSIYFIFLLVLVFLYSIFCMGSTSFLGFSYPNLLLVFLNLFFLGTSLFIFIFYPYWYPNNSIVYFVCDSASEFGRCPFIVDIKFVRSRCVLIFL